MATAAETLHSVRICCLCAEYATFDAGVNGWLLLMLGLIMPSYALRYVFFGTRWGSNSSFAMVDMLFTSLCPARILLPCPDSNPANCHLTYPKLYQHSVDLANSSAPSSITQPAGRIKPRVQLSTAETNLVYSAATRSPLTKSQIRQQVSGCPFAHQSGVSISSDATLNVSDSREPAQVITQDRADLHFPVLVPLWRIYVKERPLPIYLHTAFMTVAALLWPLQVLESNAATHLMYCVAYAAVYSSIIAMQLLLACRHLLVSAHTSDGTLQDSDTFHNGQPFAVYNRVLMCVLISVTTLSCIACDAAALERVQAAELCLAPATRVCGLGRKCPWQLVCCTICSDLPAISQVTRNGKHKASMDLYCIACGLR